MTAPIEIAIRKDRMLVTFNGAATDAEYQQYLDEMTRVLRDEFSGRRRVVINDASRFSRSNAVQRKLQADWIRDHADRMREVCAAIVFVIPSSIMRGAFRAVLWLQPLPVPHEVFSTLAEAIAWADEQADRVVPRSA